MSAPRVLIIEGDLAEAQNLEEAIFEIPERENAERESSGAGLSRRYWWNARVLHASTLAGGLQAVRDGQADLVLLNPALAEHGGIEAYRRIKVLAPDLPVILLLDTVADEGIGRLALREGAQDFLLKAGCDWESLAHAMENALERGRLVKAMWKTFLLDAGTGLVNRQGFTYLAATLQSACRASDTPLRMLMAALPCTASEIDVTWAAGAIRASIGTMDLVGKLAPGQFGILSAGLETGELSARLEANRPAEMLPLELRWSEWRPEPESRESLESVDRMIAGAEMLLDQSLSPTAVQ